MRRPVRCLLYWLVVLGCFGCNLSSSETPTPTPAAALSANNGLLTVAWVTQGNLFYWQEGDAAPRQIASGGVVRPLIAPNGETIAFTRGPSGAEETLWIVDSAGLAERQLVGRADFRTPGGKPLVGQVAWLNNTILYYNTLLLRDVDVKANDDLYRANTVTGEIALLLRPSDGGQFVISPDRQQIVVVYAGTYGRRDGRIRVVDLLGQTKTNLLFFVGISTGSHYNYYPPVYWQPDSAAVWTVIPHLDTVYNEIDGPPAQLWRLPVERPSERALLNTLSASLFGMPRWSPDGSYIAYLRRLAVPDANRFELRLASGSGEDSQVYTLGEAGALEPPQWIDTGRFVYAQGDPGTYWLGAPGKTPARIPNAAELMFAPVFLPEGWVVFASSPFETGAHLRYTRLDAASATSAIIAHIDNPPPVFDAVLSRQN